MYGYEANFILGFTEQLEKRSRSAEKEKMVIVSDDDYSKLLSAYHCLKRAPSLSQRFPHVILIGGNGNSISGFRIDDVRLLKGR